MNLIKKIRGIILVAALVCASFSMTVFAKDRMQITAISCPAPNMIHVEWQEFPGAASYDFRFAREATVNGGGNGKQRVIPAGDNIGIEVSTEYGNQNYAARVRALDAGGNAISGWSVWNTVYVAGNTASKMQFANVNSPGKKQISIEWEAYPDAAYYEIRLARASVIDAGQKGEQHIVATEPRWVSYTTKYGDIDYKVRMRALNKDKKSISEWTDWVTIHIQ